MADDGFIEVPGGKVWYRSVGGGGIPLLALHGGPGFTHHTLEPLEDLADDRQVVLYDQLGCGKSDRPGDPGLWTVERHVEELIAVREALGLDNVHLFGNSWGGMLATRYVLDRKPLIASLILAGTPDDMPRYRSEISRLFPALPPDIVATIQRHEDSGYTACPEYQAAMAVFYKRHLCRLDPWPLGVEKAFNEIGSEVYVAMNGPSEFNISGSFKDWDVTQRLAEITVPTLVLAGRHDELSPEAQADMARRIPGATFEVFENGSHMAFWDDRDNFMKTMRAFLNRVDATREDERQIEV